MTATAAAALGLLTGGQPVASMAQTQAPVQTGAFAHLLADPTQRVIQPQEQAEQPIDVAQLVSALEAVQQTLASLDIADQDQTEIPVEALQAVLSGESLPEEIAAQLAEAGLTESEAHALQSLLAALQTLEQAVRATFEENGIAQDADATALAQLFPELDAGTEIETDALDAQTLTLETLQLGLTQVTQLVGAAATAPTEPILVPQDIAPKMPVADQRTRVGEASVLSSLSLLGDTEGISLPELPVQTLDDLGPAGQKVLSVLTVKPQVETPTQPTFGSFSEIARDPGMSVLQDLGETDFYMPETERATQTAQRNADPLPPRFNAVLMNQVQAVSFEEGTTKVELTPRGLGSIEVEMRTNSDGSLAVVVRADNPAVLNSLRQEAELLANAIAGAEGGSLEFQEFDRDGADSQGSGQGGASAADVSDGTDDDSADRPQHVERLGRGELDLMT